MTPREQLLDDLATADRPATLRPVLARVEAWMAEHPDDLEVIGTAEGAAHLLEAFESGLLESPDRPT